ncbi:MAG TPA: hypothetical protein VH208_00470, partial [Myxococcaceae bacterium]|nr:hypothetical protein [Myxococcaceae bacterium]
YLLVAGMTAALASIVFWWVLSGRLASSAAGVDSYRTLDGIEVLLDAFSLYALFVVARALGLLLSVRGDDVGYGLPDSALLPALPDAVPMGRRRARPTSIRLDDEDA